MKKYRKRPVIVEAEQWLRLTDMPGIVVGCKKSGPCRHCGKSLELHGWIETLEGGHVVCPGDYVIRGISGEFYPVKPQIFDQTYEPVDQEL